MSTQMTEKTLLGNLLKFTTCPTRDPYRARQLGNWASSASLRRKVAESPILRLVNWMRISLSLSGQRERYFSRWLRRIRRDCGPLEILDVGCGGGRKDFTRYGRVAGVDVEDSLLEQARMVYESATKRSATDLNSLANRFDVVLSCDVIGHIPLSDRENVLAQMCLALKPGGYLLSLIETDSQNVWFNLARRHGVYGENLVKVLGHIALELPSHLRARFDALPLEEIAFETHNKLVPHCGDIAACLNSVPLRDLPRSLAMLVRIDRWLSRGLVIREFVNCLLNPFNRLCDRLLPLDHGTSACIVYRKRQ